MDAIAEFLPEGTSLKETAAGSPSEQPRPAPAVSAVAPESPKFKDATRVLVSVLAPLERRTLHWLAVRIPSRINSDHLTGLALAAMAGAGLSFWLASVTPVGLVLAAVFLAINWFGDSLDGTLARVRQQQRPRYGYYVDHVVDAFGALFLFGGLALSGYMSPAIAFGLLIAYFMVSIEVYLAAQSLGTFKITHFYLGPTELRILLAIGNFVLLTRPNVTIFGETHRLFDVGGAIGIAGLFITLLTSAITNTRALYRAEPLPGRERR
jgi:archaetidylinositol phosphate synthase